MSARSNRDKYGLPPRLFLYTVDQIQDMLEIADPRKILHYDGRTPGIPRKDMLLARNVMPLGEPPEWRVQEDELIRWMKHTRNIPIARDR